MKLSKKLLDIYEGKQTIELDGEAYQLNVQKGIAALVDWYMANPDLGEPIDYKDDNKRATYYKKQFKGLSVDDVRDQIKSLWDEDSLSTKDLKKAKAIS